MKQGIDNRALISIAMICFMYSLPLILWGGYYWDDVIRSAQGLYGWKENARPLADVVFYVLNSGGVNANFYPLPQILAVIVMSLTIFLCWRRLLKSKGILSVLCCIPLLTAPTFVENLLFRYDALTMSLSVMLAVIPAVTRLPNLQKFFFSVFCIFASLSLYQASITVFVIMTALVFLADIRSENYKQANYSVFFSILALLAGSAIYSKLVAKRYLVGSYNLKHSETLSFSDGGFWDGFIKNLDTFFTYIIKISPSMVLVSLLIAATFSLACCVYISINSYRNGGVHGKISSAMCLISIPVVIFCIVGPVALLKQPVFTARVLIGYGAFILSCNVISMWYLPRKFAAAFSIPLIFMTIFCYTLTNSLKSQDEYEGAITRSIINDMAALNSDTQPKIAIAGRMPKSTQTRLAEKSYPIVHNLTPILVNGSSEWALQRFRQYGLIATMASKQDIENIESNLCNTQRIRRGTYYDLYINKNILFIDFNKKCK